MKNDTFETLIDAIELIPDKKLRNLILALLKQEIEELKEINNKI